MSHVPQLTVDTAAATPPYEQIRAQIARMVGGGVLAPGTRLPTIQQLANDLELAPGTVARAYKELEREGIVVSRRRRGTVVGDAPPKVATGTIGAELDAAAQRFALDVRQLGAKPSEAIARAQHFLNT